MKAAKNSETQIQSISRALELFEIIIRSSKEYSVSELAHQAGLHPSTVSRLLSTLGSYGLLRKSQETGRYIGGYKILELSGLVMKKLKLRELAAPFLFRLMEQTGETVNLVILDGTQVVFIDSVVNSNVVTASSRIGQHLDLYCTAAGKVLLGFSSASDIDAIVSKLEFKKYTGKTFLDQETFLGELERVKELGYAVDDEEQENGLRCVAAPIRNNQSQVIAAVSISGPTTRLSDERMKTVIPVVIESAQEISFQLGFSKV